MLSLWMSLTNHVLPDFTAHGIILQQTKPTESQPAEL